MDSTGGPNPRILLLHPQNVEEDYHYAVPQVALGYLSAALKEQDYTNIDVKDAQLLRWNVEKVVNYATETKPDVIGIRVWSHQLHTVRGYLSGFKQALPNVKIVVGGPHLTVAPQYVQMVPEVDFGIAGEAEESIAPLLDHICGRSENIDISTIPGLVLMKDGALQQNPSLLRKELDTYPVDWDILDIPRYHRTNKKTTSYDQGRKKNAFVFTTRGCPYPCTYCAAYIMNGKQIRRHTAERILEDMKKLYQDYGVRQFNIMDDNFTFYRKHVVEFCDLYLKRQDEFKGVTFHNPNGVRVDMLDDEMLALMAKCGWKWLHIGVESGSPRILEIMKKRLKLDIVKENLSKIKKHGMKCWGFFILGYPGETYEDMNQTIQFAVDSELTAATFSLFSPIPGTPIYKDLVQEGRIPPDYNMTGYSSPKEWVFAAPGITGDDLQRMQRTALLRFYANPARAYHLVSDMDISTISNRFKTIFINPLLHPLSKAAKRHPATS